MQGKNHSLGLLVLGLVLGLFWLAANESGQKSWAVEASHAGAGGGNLTSFLQEGEGRPTRLVVIDSQRMSVAVYEVGREKGEIKFLSCRNLSYDLQMTGYNSAEPSPQEIKNMLDRQN